MPPTNDSELESDQQIWPKKGRIELRKARAAAVKHKQKSYTATVPKPSGNGFHDVTFFINYNKCPVIIDRVVEEFEGRKQEQRPHKQARKNGDKHVRGSLIADGHSGFNNPATNVQMPDETREEDLGWMPGPVPGGRPLPTFTGATPGPVDPALTSDSGATGCRRG